MKTILDNSQSVQVVCFNIDNEEYGIDISKIQEIIKMDLLTKIPNSPDYIEGIINLRSKIIPIFNLRTILGVSLKDYDQKTRIIIAEINNKTIGFIVDKVKEVLKISLDSCNTTGLSEDEFFSDIISVAKLLDRLILLINFDKLINMDQLINCKSSNYTSRALPVTA